MATLAALFWILAVLLLASMVLSFGGNEVDIGTMTFDAGYWQTLSMTLGVGAAIIGTIFIAIAVMLRRR